MEAARGGDFRAAEQPGKPEQPTASTRAVARPKSHKVPILKLGRWPRARGLFLATSDSESLDVKNRQAKLREHASDIWAPGTDHPGGLPSESVSSLVESIVQHQPL